MKKKNGQFYIVLFIVLFFLLSIPLGTSSRIKTAVFKIFSPFISITGNIKNRVFPSGSALQRQELEYLKLKNHLLEEEIVELKDLLTFELDLKKELETFSVPVSEEIADEHRRVISPILNRRLQAAPAKVIYRSPALWDSVLWVDVGEKDNDHYGQKIVGKNSPVVIGNSLVGVIEKVEPSQSQVRLITDSALVPSVRVFRNGGGEHAFLAKGEICGGSSPLWRSRGRILKGTGFNYDFSDEEGAARNLRASEPPIIRVGDLLITSGLDGVFPKGLHVGIVRKINPLKEGDYFYTIEAVPAVENPDELSYLFVLPPL